MKKQVSKPMPSPRRTLRKRRKLNKARVGMLLFIAVLMVFAVVLAVISSVKPGAQTGGKDDSLFRVKSVSVKGSAHYTENEIVAASGITAGQSIFLVNKRKAAENILLNFPYVEKVTVRNTSFNQLEITIEETEPAGIIEWGSGWLVVGINGRGLEILNADSSRVGDYRIIKCPTLDGAGVGRLTLDSRSREIVNAILVSCQNSNLDGVLELDLENFSDIVLNWKNTIEIRLGSDVLLEEKLDFASSTLKRVLEDHDGGAEGRIDLRFYSQSNQKAVFTPAELLEDNK